DFFIVHDISTRAEAQKSCAEAQKSNAHDIPHGVMRDRHRLEGVGCGNGTIVHKKGEAHHLRLPNGYCLACCRDRPVDLST
ncbi:MAG: hypothetical protein J1F13_05380, partial [Prevotellaceae bacterium]|nr:hypothetical protein [Prevotellaceae bacterium]